jgi:glycosyltransferase involved in cell wall biosynthesis
MPSPLISIIVATFNAERTLERCLASVAHQTSDRWELIVIDGASSDRTNVIVERYLDHIAFRVSERDSGIYDAWNKGIAAARGDYVCFIGADDAFADPTSLQTLIDAVGPERYDLVSSRCRWIDTDGKVLGEGGGAWDFRRIGRRMPICHPGLWHARDLFVRYGTFDTSYRITADLDLLLRLPPSTRALHVPDITIDVENGGVSRTQTLRRLREQRRALAGTPRFGPVRAWLVWMDKMWRYPVARIFRLPF